MDAQLHPMTAELDGSVLSARLPSMRFVRWLVVLLLLPCLLYLCFLTVGVWLSSPAKSPLRADAVVVLGGGAGVRYARGRELLLDGQSSHLLVINPSYSERQDAQLTLGNKDVRFDSTPRSTWQEAQTVRAWMQANGWKSVLVVSDPPHLLRVGYAFASNLRGTGLTYALVATNPPFWSAWRWWQNPVSRGFVGSEVLKLVYYLVRYRFGLG